MTPIAKKQTVLIHIARQQTGMTDDDYRALLMNTFGVDTSKHLNYFQAEALMKEFRRRGFRIKRTRGTKKRKQKLPPDITQLPSPDILRKIEMLRQDVRWQYHDGYNRWLKKRFGIERITTMKIAQKVIEGLKSMIRNQQPVTAVWD